MINLGLDFKVLLTYQYAYYKRIKFDMESTPTTKMAGLVDLLTDSIDVLLFGDSVTERISFADKDERTLFSMFRDGLGSATAFYHITHSAYYSDIFYLYLRLLLCSGIKPKTIIMPVNLRSFSPQWDYNPMFQNSSHIELLLRQLKLKGIILNDYFYAKKSVWQFISSEVVYSGSRFTRIRHFLRTIASKPKTATAIADRKRSIFIFHYMNLVSESHRKIKALKDIVKLCDDNNLRLTIYFTPINYETAGKYVGHDFLTNLKANVRTISDQALSSANDSSRVKIVDYSTLLTPEYFFNPEETTEHLSDIGREKLSQSLLDLLMAEQ